MVNAIKYQKNLPAENGNYWSTRMFCTLEKCQIAVFFSFAYSRKTQILNPSSLLSYQSNIDIDINSDIDVDRHDCVLRLSTHCLVFLLSTYCTLIIENWCGGGSLSF